jgi:coenzyme PQQ precursor peptide PqqA
MHTSLRLSCLLTKSVVELLHTKETTMKTWMKPEVTETEAGMEVTSYLPAEFDRA